MTNIQKNLIMSRKKTLKVIFAKVYIKCHLRMRNMTKKPMALDLLREEIQAVILNVVLNEVEAFMVTVSRSAILKFTNEHIDIVIVLLLCGSTQKVAYKLNLPRFTYFEVNNSTWSTKNIEMEQYPLLAFLNVSTIKQDMICYTNVLTILTENLIIKLSDIIAYQLFSHTHISPDLIKCYCGDPNVFKINITNLNAFTYYQSYLNSIFLNLRKYYNQTYSLVLMTKNGLMNKSVYNAQLAYPLKISTFELYIIQFFNLINFLIMEKTLQN